MELTIPNPTNSQLQTPPINLSMQNIHFFAAGVNAHEHLSGMHDSVCEEVVALCDIPVSSDLDESVKRKKTRRSKKKRCVPYHKPPTLVLGRFEKQTRYNCAKHAVNNLLGYELLTIENLTESANILSSASKTYPVEHCREGHGLWSIDCVHRTLLIHGYILRRWSKPKTERDLMTESGLHMVQTPPHPDSVEPISHWIGVDGSRQVILDSFSNYPNTKPGRPIQLTWANLQRKNATKHCTIYTIERMINSK